MRSNRPLCVTSKCQDIGIIKAELSKIWDSLIKQLNTLKIGFIRRKLYLLIDIVL